MRILGIDPGIGRMGWGIIDSESGKVRVVNYGCIETPKEDEKPQRLLTIYNSITGFIEKYHPETFGIEGLFFNSNAKTAFSVGEARGVALLCAAQNKLSIGIYTPLQVKIAVTGYGKAEKAQVGQMVKVLLTLKGIPKPDDTTDALAVALTHAFSYKRSKNL